MRKIALLTSITLICMNLCMNSSGSIADSSSNSFTVSYERKINITSARIYTSFTADIAKWWDPDHTWSGSAANLSIVPEAGGCFCEKLENGGSVQHMRVLYAAPGQVFRMSGGLGPLQQFPVNGILTLNIKESPDGFSIVTLSYSVGGFIPGGLPKLAGAVDQVMGIQFERFMKYAAALK
jgi:uncharacterized protein YndB with AHSA1/START domain